jgi:hypothetical protein
VGVADKAWCGVGHCILCLRAKALSAGRRRPRLNSSVRRGGGRAAPNSQGATKPGLPAALGRDLGMSAAPRRRAPGQQGPGAGRFGGRNTTVRHDARRKTAACNRSGTPPDNERTWSKPARIASRTVASLPRFHHESANINAERAFPDTAR